MTDLAYCNLCTNVQLLAFQVASVMDIYTEIKRVSCNGALSFIYLKDDIDIIVTSKSFEVNYHGAQPINFVKENFNGELSEVIACVLKVLNMVEGKPVDASRRFRHVSASMKDFTKFFNYFMSINIYEWIWQPSFLSFSWKKKFNVTYTLACRDIKDGYHYIERSFADTYDSLREDNFEVNIKYSILLADPQFEF